MHCGRVERELAGVHTRGKWTSRAKALGLGVAQRRPAPSLVQEENPLGTSRAGRGRGGEEGLGGELGDGDAVRGASQ